LRLDRDSIPAGDLAMNSDQEHLRLLVIFSYILAGLTALMACFPLIHMAIGFMFLSHPEMLQGPPNQPPMPPEMSQFIGTLFIVISAAAVLLGWIYAFCLFMAGKNLSNRRNYMFCLIVAGFSCLNIPFGTILGIFTLVVLLRPSVKTLFEEQKYAGPF
jgi:hypothetical protein